MSLPNLSSLGVGDLLFSTEFRVEPQDVVAWEHGRMLDADEDRIAVRAGLQRPPAVGSPLPEGLVFARALDALGRSSGIAGCRVDQTSVGKLRSLREARVGESLICVATVRYRARRDLRCFLTLALEVRTSSHTVAEVEVGVELSAPTPTKPSTKLRLREFARAA